MQQAKLGARQVEQFSIKRGPIGIGVQAQWPVDHLDDALGAVEVFHGPLRLDPGAYRATLDGEMLDLTRTEFGLLHLLLRNPGRVFGRSYLLDTVWGETYVPGDRSVDNAVLRLRKKLGDFGEAIETVWGVGYRLRQQE